MNHKGLIPRGSKDSCRTTRASLHLYNVVVCSFIPTIISTCFKLINTCINGVSIVLLNGRSNSFSKTRYQFSFVLPQQISFFELMKPTYHPIDQMS